jgi:hypothetical protein
MAGSLQRQRLLIACGFVIVGFAFGGQILAIYHGSPAIEGPNYELFFGAACTVGHGLLALATWAWFKWQNSSWHSANQRSQTVRCGQSRICDWSGVSHLLLGQPGH